MELRAAKLEGKQKTKNKFARVAKFRNPCEISIFFTFVSHFCVFFPNFPYVIVVLVIYVVLVVYNGQTTLCKDSFSFIIEFWGKLVEQAPVSFHFLSFYFLFSLSKHPLRMISQRMSG